MPDKWKTYYIMIKQTKAGSQILNPPHEYPLLRDGKNLEDAVHHVYPGIDGIQVISAREATPEEVSAKYRYGQSAYPM